MLRIVAATSLVSLVALAAPGCSSSGSGNTLPVTPPSQGPPQTGPEGKYIKHIVVIVQENRTFNDIFAGFKGADSTLYGYTHDGTKVRLKAMTFKGPDVLHNWGNAMADWNGGGMNGFDRSLYTNGRPAGTYAYAYIQHTVVAPYWTMARQYTLADHMFPTMFGPTFTAHIDLIASTTNLTADEAEVDGPTGQPWGCDAPAGTRTLLLNPQRVETGDGPFPCFTQYNTMADTLDDAQISWKYYAPEVKYAGGRLWSPFAAIRKVRYGPDWQRNIISPQTTVLTDAANGKLAQVSWVIPDAADSDHAGSNSNKGPSWVAGVVNAIGESQYWSSTAIVVLWDDWGGWYDSVAPPQLGFVGLGIRVPCIIISPYAKAGYVSHTQYEFGSVLRLIEETFKLPSLGPAAGGYTDMRAHSLVDSFDFKQQPRGFKPIPAPYSPAYFLRQPPSGVPPDTE
ncbi:MAG: alkaline phosphatase family protein [Candidatus Cybelea sp.]